MSKIQNASNEGQIKEIERRERFRRERELNDVRVVLSTEAGRRFIWRYIGHCRVLGECFNHSGSVTAYQLGERNIGLRLMADIDAADPEAYLKMRQESLKETREE